MLHFLRFGSLSLVQSYDCPNMYELSVKDIANTTGPRQTTTEYEPSADFLDVVPWHGNEVGPNLI